MDIGVHNNVTREEYESWDALNYSTMKLFDRSPAHAREAMIHPTAATPAMRLGSAIHSAILEPELFDVEFGAAPTGDRRSKAGRAAWADWEVENAGKIALSPAEMSKVSAMKKAVFSHPIAKEVLAKAVATEASVLWSDTKTKIMCKARIDAISSYSGWTIALDLKSSQNSSVDAFQRVIGTYRYDMQAHWYLRGLNAISPTERRFWFIVVEPTAPYGVTICEPSFATLELGKRACDKFVESYSECIKTGEWPSYSTGVETVNAPNWIFHKEEQEQGEW